MKILGVDLDNVQARPFELRYIWNGCNEIRYFKQLEDFVNYMTFVGNMVEKYPDCEWTFVSLEYLD